MSRILILGGTGAMGIHLVSLLENTEHEVIVTTRKQRANRGNIRYIQGNAHDENFLRLLLDGSIDVVVDFMIYTTEEFRLRAELMLSSCRQYVYLSSSRVYSNQDRVITENTPRLLDVCTDKDYLATDEYALTKARQENILRESGKNNWTIIRPYITFAENRLQLGVLELQSWLYRALLGHTIVFSEDIASKYTTLTYGYDVARGIAAILGNEKAYGRAFHITVSKSMKWSEILDVYLNVIESETGLRSKVKMVERHPYLNNAIGKYQVIYDRYYDRRFDNSAIGEFIDTATFLPTEEGIRKSLVTFICDNREKRFPLDPFHEGLYDKITGETTDLQFFVNFKHKVYYLTERYVPFMSPTLRTLKHLLKS